jgi:O-antigen/teichoic acid export membrane protein
MGRFARDTAWTMGAHVATFGLGLLTTALLTRALGPEGAGRYGLATTFASLMASVASLGLGPASTYFAARRTHPLPVLLGTSLFLSAAFGLAGAAVGGGVAALFGDALLPGVGLPVVLATLALVPATLLWLTMRFTTLGLGRIGQVNRADVGCVLFQLLGMALLTVLAGLRELGAVLGMTAGTLLATAMLWSPLRGEAGPVRWRPDGAFARDALRYGVQAHVANIIQFLNYRADVFLVGGYLGAEATGYYTVAVALAERMRVLSQAAGLVLLPRVAAEADEETRRRFTPLVMRAVLLLSVPPALLVLLLADWIVRLLASERFLPSLAAFQVLVPAIVLLGAASVLANDLAGRGRPLANSALSAVGLVVNIGLNLWWIPAFGILGAAWASAVSYSLHFVLQVLLYCRISRNSLADVLLPRAADAVALWQVARREARGLARRRPPA